MSVDLFSNHNAELLFRLQGMLSRLAPSEYTATHDRLSSASVGTHIRHILDHYFIFLNGLASGMVDYDNRQRHTETESSIKYARGAIGRIATQLGQLSGPDAPLKIKQSVTVRVPTPEQPSTVGRELLFLHSHTTHHLAVIALILRSENISIPPDIDVAPSTLKYRKQAPCAR